jgi:hypothetical protein
MPTSSSSADYGIAWHNKEPGSSDVHGELVSYGRTVQQAYKSSHQFVRALEKIYEARALRRYSGALSALSSRMGGDALARLNVAGGVVDTVSARLSKRRAMPAFRVDNADWSLKRKAKKYREFILGKMSETEFEDLSPQALQDGSVTGHGITQIDDDGNDVCCERILRDELLFDPRELKYGKPWQAIRTMRISRDVLAAKFPAFKSQIRDAANSQRLPHESIDDPDMMELGSLDGYVDVFKAWRRPTDEDAKDGRFAMCIDNATLTYEKWDQPRFPFATFRYKKPQRGYWGLGLVEQVMDIQQRINSIVRAMQMNIDVTSMGSYLVNELYDQPIELMTGARPFKFSWKGPQGMQPQWKAADPLSPQTIQILEFFIRQAFEIPGVSQSAASSKSALGLNASGIALDTQYDIESERFAMVERQYAKYRLDAAQLYLDAAGRVAKRRYEEKGRKKSYVAVSAPWRRRDAIERLEYKDVEMKADQYRLEMEPVNYIPDTRAGKFATIQELTQGGIIPQWLAPALYDEPDLARAQLINCAAYYNLERIMEGLGDKNIPMEDLQPEPYHDLPLAEKMGLAYFNHAQSEIRIGSEDEIVIDRYRQFVDAVLDMKAKASAAEQPAAPPMDPAAMGMPPDPMAMGGPPGMPPAPGGAPMPPDMGGMIPMPVAA